MAKRITLTPESGAFLLFTEQLGERVEVVLENSNVPESVKPMLRDSLGIVSGFNKRLDHSEFTADDINGLINIVNRWGFQVGNESLREIDEWLDDHITETYLVYHPPRKEAVGNLFIMHNEIAS